MLNIIGTSEFMLIYTIKLDIKILETIFVSKLTLRILLSKVNTIAK